MRLAISNIAWDVNDDENVAKLLHRFNVDAIDIAPTKYFSNPVEVSLDEVMCVKTWWRNKGIDITGMQSLLFGTHGLNVFGSLDTQNELLKHLEHIARLGDLLGARRLVFGSPKNRDRSGLDDTETKEKAVCFFTRLGDLAKEHDVVFCLEPNPACYGANFMINSEETADLVRAVNHKNIQMQLDTGAVTINNENISEIVDSHKEIIGHIHLSEPNLVTLGDTDRVHDVYASIIAKYLSDSVITIEMLSPSRESSLGAIEDALRFASTHYLRV